MNDCRFSVSPVNYPDPDPDPDRSRGRNVSFPTSLGYLNPSLVYPPLPYRTNTPTIRYASTSYLSTPLHSHPIHSAQLPCPNTLSYCTLPSPTLSSHLLSLSSPLAYPTLPSPPVYPALPKDSEKVKVKDVLVPECIGAKIVWCKMSFGGLKWPSAWKVQETCMNRKVLGPNRLWTDLLCNKTSGAKCFPCNETSIGRNGLVPKCLATEF